MKTSIATVSISGDFAEKLAAIAAAGFDGVEIFENDFLAFDGSPRDVGRMARDAGLEITLFQPFRDFEGLPEPQRGRAFDRAERKFDVMQELGTDLMLVCSSVSPVSLGGIDRAAADFRELGERAAKRGLRVGYEALAWGRHVNDHRDAWEIVRRADHPNIGLILDSFHTLARKIDVGSIRSIPKDKIFIVQLADAPLIDMDLLYWSRHFRNMPGEGDLPVKDFMRAVAATGYDGYLSLEIFNDQFRGGSPRSIAARRPPLAGLPDGPGARARSRRSRIAVPRHARPRSASTASSSSSSRPTRPVRRSCRGCFDALGFAQVGRHVSKDVDALPAGRHQHRRSTPSARASRTRPSLVHGTSAYAIGLKVEDAQATVARAQALGRRAFEQPVGPGELTIPAIRGVGGGVIYFIDGSADLARVWDIEFVPPAMPTSASDAGLTRIDHVGQTMDHDEMLTWLLFYTSIFRTQEDADGRRHRSGRARPQPGDRKRRRRRCG